MVKGICPTCGREFTKSHKTTYCSRECIRNKEFVFEENRKCDICGKSFRARSHNSKYCGERCRMVGENRLYIKRREEGRYKNSKRRDISIEEFWRSIAPGMTLGEATINLSSRYNLSEKEAKREYKIWRFKYVRSVSCG